MDGGTLAAPIMWGRHQYPYPGKYLGTGNRCGHNPHAPRWDRFSTPDTWRKVPKFVEKLVRGVSAYYADPDRLPTLFNQAGKTNQDGRPRLNRSEAREAECLVLAAILRVTEYASLRVGTPKDDGGFISRSCGEIARLAGLEDPQSDPDHPQPSQRFWRAFRRLKIAGAFSVHTQYECLPDGSKRARPAIKTLNPHFLIACGRVTYDALKKFRDWCSKSLKKQRAAHRQQFPNLADAEKALGRLRQQAAHNGASVAPEQSPADPPEMPDCDAERELRRLYSLEALQAADGDPLPSYEAWVKHQRT